MTEHGSDDDLLIAHPVLRPLPPEQQALIDVLAERWVGTGKWPVLDYLNRKLLKSFGTDAMEALSRLPVVHRAGSQQIYRLVFMERGGIVADPDQRVGLTFGGLYHYSPARATLDQLLLVVRFLADRDASLEPDPEHAVRLELPVIDLLTAHLRDELRGWHPENLARALEHEPPLWGAVSPDYERLRLQAGVLSRFSGVQDPADYVHRVVRYLDAEARPPIDPAGISPLELPDALGYLDAVWYGRYRAHLVGRTVPSSPAKLALACASADEFAARLSALADVLGHLNVALAPEELSPGLTNNMTLARIRRRLELDLEARAFGRVDEAIRTLQGVVRIRAALQHSGPAGEMAGLFRQLDLRYPPPDMGAAWDQIRRVSATAIHAIREELQASGPEE